MNQEARARLNWRGGLGGATLAVLVGLFLWAFPVGDGLEHLSYDLPFLFTSAPNLQNVVIIYMDEKSFLELEQKPDNWDRSLHARFLDRMTSDGARLVVFDIWFTDPGPPQADTEFARAIKANGKVVLAATLASDSRPGFSGRSLLRPAPQFREAAAGWGLSDVLDKRESVIRWYYPTNDLGPSLPWLAAALAGVTPAKAPAEASEKRWLNYYGGHGTIPNVSYCEVTNQAPGYFRDKIVFVGGGSRKTYAIDRMDEYCTPPARWGGEYFPGVEIIATAFLNLQRGDGLTRLSPFLEALMIALSGLVFGWLLSAVRPWPAVGLALPGVIVVALLAVLLWQAHVWFAWMIVAGTQIPCALAWPVLFRVQEALRERTRSRSQPASTAVTAPLAATQPGGTRLSPNIPDHTLVRSIGRGSYGEVWLARNAIGLHHAVKIIYRDRFQDADPYEREFKGMQKFMPISLSHPWLVHLLHVGRNDAEGYFFYIMEAGDDEVSGSKIDPANYSPKNLATELRKKRRLPVEECVDLGLYLTAALDYLHQSQLIHRDIKPSNIIYVNGVPKMADIGLVTDLGSKSGDASYLGTEGYIAPEGPGTAGADVYSLGKLIYEASMGRDRYDFPDLPTSLVEKGDNQALMQLNQIILKACEPNPKQRYQSAAEMYAELKNLQDWIKAQPKP